MKLKFYIFPKRLWAETGILPNFSYHIRLGMDI